MDRGRPSTTAMGTALMRAAHTRLDRPVLIEDAWGDRLILDEERETMLARAGGGDADALLRAHPSYGTVIVRARYAEDLLADAVSRGARLELCGIPLPRGLHLVAADLSETALDDALASSPFQSDSPAFFSWLGVTSYLTPEANLATLGAIASCAPAGSELVFSYLDQRLLDSDVAPERLQRTRAHVASIGEPWVSGFDPDELGSVLRGAGLEMLENLGPEDLAARYCAGRDDGLGPSDGAHLAHARVVAG